MVEPGEIEEEERGEGGLEGFGRFGWISLLVREKKKEGRGGR
jgi:hypothetical protein